MSRNPTSDEPTSAQRPGKDAKQTKKAAKQAKKAKQTTASPQPQLPQPHPAERLFHNVKEISANEHTRDSFTVMTYNVLAQTLVKRELFPHAEAMLKWKTRRKMIIEEIALYKPSIMCLQEVDNYAEFYQDELDKLGFKSKFFKHPTKQHGCVIAYAANSFEFVEYNTVDYDTDSLCPPTKHTGNVAQLLALKRVHTSQTGIIIGNTHLYWKPSYFYERLRQGTIYATRLYEFSKLMEQNESHVRWFSLMLGDFNTAPIDPLYSIITGRSLTEPQITQLEKSRNVTEEGDYETGTIHNLMEILDLEQLFQQTKIHWHSVYSCYGALDCALSDEIMGEPKFTTYAPIYKGTVDYIFIDPSLCVSKVLTLPPREHLTPALPNWHFGSDHLCLIAVLEFCK